MEKTGSYIRRGVHLTALRTDKFKFGLLSLSFLLPLTAENASAVNLAARWRCWASCSAVRCWKTAVFGANIWRAKRKT